MIDPHVPETLLSALQPGFDRHRLPRPSTIAPLGQPAILGHYEVSFEDGPTFPMHLQLRLHDLDGNGFQAAYLAIQILKEQPAIPTLGDCLVVPLDVLGVPAMVAGFLPGQNGRVVLNQHPDGAQAVHAALGRVAAALAEVEMAEFGLRATPRGFSPERYTWREEWMARVHRRVLAARSGGTALEPVFGQVVARIDELEASLDEVDGWRLVHGGLGPDVVTLTDDDGALALAGVFGWHSAVAGDPVSEWAPLLYLGDDALVDVVRGYGAERVRELLDPSTLARLEVYRLTHCLTTLAEIGADVWPREVRPGLVNRVAGLAQDMLDTPARARLEGALDHLAGGTTPSPPEPPDVLDVEAHNRLRYVLEALRHDPPLHAWEQPVWLVAAATCLLQADLPDGPVSQGYAEVALQLFSMLPDRNTPRGVEPIADRDAWWKQLAGRVLDHHHALPDMKLRSSLATVWLAWLVIERLGHVADDSVLRGLESMVLGTLAKERLGATQQTSSSTNLTQAVLAWGAARSLVAAFFDDGDRAELLQVLSSQLAEAWDVFDVGATTRIPDLEEFVVFYARRERQQNLTVPIAPVVLVLRAFSSDLPADAGTLLAAMGVRPPPE